MKRFAVLLLAVALLATPVAALNKFNPAVVTATVNSSTDVTVTVPFHCTAVYISSRTGTPFKVGFAVGAIAAGNSKLVPANSEWFIEDMGFVPAGSEMVIYLRSTIASDVLEVEEWIGG